jgi:hypothetical protein
MALILPKNNMFRSRVCAVVAATGCEQEGRGVWVRASINLIFSPLCEFHAKSSPSWWLLLDLSGDKAAVACSWSLTSNICSCQDHMDHYTHRPMCLHGVALNVRPYVRRENKRVINFVLTENKGRRKYNGEERSEAAWSVRETALIRCLRTVNNWSYLQ